MHLTAVAWWLLPDKPFPVNSRSAPLPPKLLETENRLFAWKASLAGKALPRLLNRYTAASGAFQSWWMFSPNPTEASSLT